MKLTSYGAAEGVTGSCHLLEVGGKRVLLDCGIFQGNRGPSEKNEPPFPFDPASIDYLVVSHAHLDHIGRIPLLVREGFAGKILSNRPTYELARLSLLDSVNILDYEARRANKRRKEGEPRIQPLFTEEDVFDAVECWDSHMAYNSWQDVCKGVKLRLHDAGHILGSSFLEFQLSDGPNKSKFVFSGDLGNIDKPIIRDPQPCPKTDFLLLESTYGDREHRSFADSVAEIEEIICRTIKHGNVLIPSFALERAQELIYVLYLAWRDGRIPRETRIYLDSPMAINATGIFKRHKDYYDEHALDLYDRGEDPFDFPALTYTRHSRESAKLNSITKGAVILAGSGMCTGGRILDHLRHNLGRSNTALVFCGFQSKGTLGRRLVDGAKSITIRGDVITCEASIHTVNGFSGHAGQSTMTDWARGANPEQIYLVHGEEGAKETFAKHLKSELPQSDVNVMDFARSIALTSQPVQA
ncbi:MAG: MBL fold metallo-hydrolase [Bradymonadaceae bacterium]|nr:MBL fold metallo-hydrolase [Lujinxingiaceae bacterium]